MTPDVRLTALASDLRADAAAWDEGTVDREWRVAFANLVDAVREEANRPAHHWRLVPYAAMDLAKALGFQS